MFDTLLTPYDSELLAFGSNWRGPRQYELHREALVAVYRSADDDDGQTVEVYCTAMPARFYTIRALAGLNSVGDAKEPWEFRTGSSQAQLAADIAKAASEGMLGFHPLAAPDSP